MSNAPGEVFEGRRVAGGVVVVGAEPQAVVLLLERLGQHGDLGPHCLRDLDREVAKASQADDRHALARTSAPMAERRVGGDARAQQRCGSGFVQTIRDGKHEVLVDDDAGGEAALGDLPVLADAAEHEGVPVQAVLLLALAAVGAYTAGVGHAADADPVPYGVLGDLVADPVDDADDLVTRHQRVGDRAELAAGEVDVRMADPAVGDVDDDVERARLPALDRHRDERLGA